MDTENIILKIIEMKVAADYGRASITVQPNPIYHKILVPKDNFEETETGEKIITLEGIKFIFKELNKTLILENQDF